jgi:hypothetical protein
VGAVAEVFDISCLIGTPFFARLSNMSYAMWESAPASMTAQALVSAVATTPRIEPVG